MSAPSTDPRTATGDDLTRLIHESPAESLLTLLENPALDEKTLVLLLHRRDLPADVLTEILQRRHLLKSYPVKKSLAFHHARPYPGLPPRTHRRRPPRPRPSRSPPRKPPQLPASRNRSALA